jgi:hypothetical protein
MLRFDGFEPIRPDEPQDDSLRKIIVILILIIIWTMITGG